MYAEVYFHIPCEVKSNSNNFLVPLDSSDNTISALYPSTVCFVKNLNAVIILFIKSLSSISKPNFAIFSIKGYSIAIYLPIPFCLKFLHIVPIINLL